MLNTFRDHVYHQVNELQHVQSNEIILQLSDYGGDLESIEELSKKNLQQLKDMKDYFELDEKQVYECVTDL